MLVLIKRLEVAGTATHDKAQPVSLHIIEQDAVIARKLQHLVAGEQLGVDVVRPADVETPAGGLDALALDAHDGLDNIEVKEREGVVRGIVRLLLGITCVDLLEVLICEEGTGILVGDVGGRGGLFELNAHDYGLSPH